MRQFISQTETSVHIFSPVKKIVQQNLLLIVDIKGKTVLLWATSIKLMLSKKKIIMQTGNIRNYFGINQLNLAIIYDRRYFPLSPPQHFLWLV